MKKIQKKLMFNECLQRAKKVLCDSTGLADFAVGLVILFLTCPMGKCCFLGKFKLQKDCN